MQKGETLVIDYNSNKKLVQGEYPIDFTLDLHGYHLQDAYDALVEAIEFGHSGGMRCLLIITGKGLHSNGDGQTLREQVPVWLSNNRLSSKIIKYTNAHKKHGGEGALYVLLKRVKN